MSKFTIQDFEKRAKKFGYKETEDPEEMEISSMMWDAFPVIGLAKFEFSFDEHYVMKYLCDRLGELEIKEQELWLSFLPKLTKLQQEVKNFLTRESVSDFEETAETLIYYEFDRIKDKNVVHFCDALGDPEAYTFGEFANGMCFIQIQNHDQNVFLLFDDVENLFFFLKFHCNIEKEF